MTTLPESQEKDALLTAKAFAKSCNQKEHAMDKAQFTPAAGLTKSHGL